MENNKLSTQLNAALNATNDELNNSSELRTGYLPDSDSWEVIVRHTGSLNNIKQLYPSILVTALINNYGVLKIPKPLIDEISALNNIIYMEKPKRLFFQINNGKRASCIPPLQSQSPTPLTGEGTLIGIIDSGIDYSHPDFISENGETRIRLLWDQSLGQVYDSSQINAALNAPTLSDRFSICPSIDLSGHGSHVAGIAAGNGRASMGSYRGIAYQSQLIVVKLATPAPGGFPSTIELITAVDFCIKESIRLNMPISINLSFGNTYGSHSGTSLTETFLDEVVTQYRCCIVCGSGNEGSSFGHSSGRFSQNGQLQSVELSVSEFTPSLSIQLWKNPWDMFLIEVKNPSGISWTIPSSSGSYRFTMTNTDLYVTVGEAVPYSPYQEIYIDLNSVNNSAYIENGIWTINITAINIKSGIWDMWLPGSNVRNSSTGFLLPDANTTLTIPSTASKIITVGAYDSINNRFASFSGRGYTWNTNQIKPELAAPGVNIVSCAPGGGYESRSGTSMATPFVTGSCSLLMEWGIVRGNDMYLYGEKIKAALIQGTKKLPFIDSYPNELVGWGALCLRDSLPFF